MSRSVSSQNRFGLTIQTRVIFCLDNTRPISMIYRHEIGMFWYLIKEDLNSFFQRIGSFSVSLQILSENSRYYTSRVFCSLFFSKCHPPHKKGKGEESLVLTLLLEIAHVCRSRCLVPLGFLFQLVFVGWVFHESLSGVRRVFLSLSFYDRFLCFLEGTRIKIQD